MKKIILSLICLSLMAFTNQDEQVSENDYRIYSVKLGREVTLNDMVEVMKNFDVLFYGEEHNDSVTHYLEKKIFELLYAKFNNKAALSMEMFDRDVQHVMNEYLQGHIREKNFLKDARVWSNYRDYRPMVELAKDKKLNVICANSPSRYTNLAGRKGQKALMELPKQTKNYFAPLPYDTASGKYYEKLMGLSNHIPAATPDSTKPKAPPMMMGSFNLIMAQSLWDATMAYSIAEYYNKNKDNKILHVQGRFHSDEGFAVATQLKKYNSKIRQLIISSGTDENFPAIDWNNHKHLGDYIIITNPEVPKTYE